MGRKKKFILEFKLQCVLEFLEDSQSERTISKKYNINQKLVNDWIRIYRYNGLNGLLPKKYTSYDSNFKLKVIKTIEKENLSI